jgi:hypothetical protein
MSEEFIPPSKSTTSSTEQFVEQEPYSGMKIEENTSSRRFIDNEYESYAQKIHQEVSSIYDDEIAIDSWPSRIQQIIPIYAANNKILKHRLETIEGIEVLVDEDISHNDEIKCQDYVFWNIKKEEWAKPTFRNPNPLDNLPLNDSLAFLEARGYTVEERPQEDDIVAYRGSDDEKAEKHDETGQFSHFGIYLGSGKVISKWGNGPIVKHPLEIVPSTFGSRVYFLRKTRPEEAWVKAHTPR